MFTQTTTVDGFLEFINQAKISKKTKKNKEKQKTGEAHQPIFWYL
jgi:hypothetical protein